MQKDVPFKYRWLSGGVPEHWKIVEPRRIFKLRREPEKPGDIHLTPSQKFGVLPQEEYMRITGSRVVQNLSGTLMQHVEPGDFISHLRTFQGGLELVTQPGKVSPAYTVLEPTEAVFPGYFKHVFKSEGYISQIASVTDQLRDGQSMRYNEFNLTWLLLPPFQEQIKMAEQLDRELAEINELITNQKQLLQLITERFELEREKILSDVKGKKVQLSRVLLGLKDGTHSTHKRIESGGQVLLSAKNISSGKLVIGDKESRISNEEADQITSSGFPTKGDVMMILVGATYGKTAMYLEEETLPFQRSVGFFRPNLKLILSEYLIQVMRSQNFQNQLSANIKTSAQPGIYLGDVSSTPIPLPDIDSQKLFVTNIFLKEKIINKLSIDIYKSIELLNSRKSSILNTFFNQDIL